MGENSKISWTDHTFNPWWGCTEVSPGCDACYARDLSHRFKVAEWGAGAPRVLASDRYWTEPLRWNASAEKAGTRKRVFCASMADVFDAEAPQEWRERLWGLVGATPWLDWLLLTKRPNLIRRFVPRTWLKRWPRNAWLGTSVESEQQTWRLAALCKVPGNVPVKFVSAEPLIGPLDVSIWLYSGFIEPPHPDVLHWVIAGCESGPKRRPAEVDWFRSLRDQCQAAGAAFFLKQLIVDGVKVETPELDGRTWTEMPGGGVKSEE